MKRAILGTLPCFLQPAAAPRSGRGVRTRLSSSQNLVKGALFICHDLSFFNDPASIGATTIETNGLKKRRIGNQGLVFETQRPNYREAFRLLISYKNFSGDI
jgi:hypothetical protein